MIQDHRNLGLTGKEDEEELKKCKQRLTCVARSKARGKGSDATRDIASVPS